MPNQYYPKKHILYRTIESKEDALESIKFISKFLYIVGLISIFFTLFKGNFFFQGLLLIGLGFLLEVSQSRIIAVALFFLVFGNISILGLIIFFLSFRAMEATFKYHKLSEKEASNSTDCQNSKIVDDFEDNITESAECPSCKGIVPSGADTCSKCGWSYKKISQIKKGVINNSSSELIEVYRSYRESEIQTIVSVLEDHEIAFYLSNEPTPKSFAPTHYELNQQKIMVNADDVNKAREVIKTNLNKSILQNHKV